MTVKWTCTVKTKFKDAHKNPVPEMLNSLMNEKDQNTWVMRLCYLTKTLHPSFTLIIKPKCLAHAEESCLFHLKTHHIGILNSP